MYTLIKIESKEFGEWDNSKIHVSSNFILSISLLIMFDTLLQRPSLHCNTPLHLTTVHRTTQIPKVTMLAT